MLRDIRNAQASGRRLASLAALVVMASLVACADPTAPGADHATVRVADAANKGNGNGGGGGGGGGTPSDIPVTTTLAGDGHIQSDGLGDYQNGVSGVSSIIQGIGDWVLDQTARKSTRATRLDLTDRASGSGTAPFTVANVQVRFISKSTDVGGNYRTMGAGDTGLFPLSLAFSYGNKNYGLRMNTQNHPQTDHAQVTCTQADASNACTRWRLVPSGADGRNIARLEEVTKQGSVLIGLYYMDFDIVIAR